MSTAPKYIPSYTVADYQQWQGDWELWQGIPIAMTPSPSGFHQRISLRVARALLSAIEEQGCHAEVLQETDWVIADDTVVRPDIVVVCGDTPAGHIHEPPALVAEILSPSTANRDLTDKLRLYQENDVGTYLILDPIKKSVRLLVASDGAFVETNGIDELDLSLCGDCRITVTVGDFF